MYTVVACMTRGIRASYGSPRIAGLLHLSSLIMYDEGHMELTVVRATRMNIEAECVWLFESLSECDKRANGGGERECVGRDKRMGGSLRARVRWSRPST